MAREIGPVAPILTPAEEKDLNAGEIALLMEGDEVGIVEIGHHEILLPLHEGERPDAVADHPRLLELPGIGIVLHAPRQLLLHLLAPPPEEALGLAQEFLIAFGIDPPDARGAASFDLIKEAGSRAAPEDAVIAGTQEKGPLQRDESAIDRARGREGAEIIAAWPSGTAMLGELRKIGIAGKVYIGEGFVVPEQHIVAWHQTLDEIAFEQQRLDLGRGHYDFHRVGQRHHALQPHR